MIHPLVILALGIVAVVGMIIVLRINAFIALITAALLVSLLSPGPVSERMARVAESFGGFVGKIGIVIAMAAVIGKCLMQSGAADRIVRSFVRALGERRAPEALCGASFVLAVPVFFDTVFYLMVPLARSFWHTTRKNYMLYILAIATGGVVTHGLVPPTPGPLVMAANLGFDVGTMILVGAMIGLPAAVVGLLASRVLNRWQDVPCRPYAGEEEPEPLPDDQLPGLAVSLAPILLPVILISGKTITKALVESYHEGAPGMLKRVAEAAALLGDANLALLISGALAMGVLWRWRGLTLGQLAGSVESALMSGGVIILITAAGGAFGEMLKTAGVGEAVQSLFAQSTFSTGTVMLLAGFAVAALLKIAQGSSTVAMLTTSAMLASMGASAQMLGFHPVYLATAIAGGSLVVSWMNDSGFWIFARMSVLSETEALKSWTVLLVVIGVAILVFTFVGAALLPLA